MFGFLQGFSYGLFLSCLPWFLIGMVDPRLAIPVTPPTRWRAVLRYVFGLPFVSFSLWLTSLWGGFDPSFNGWIAGLLAIAVEVPVERRWRGWLARRKERAAAARIEAEAQARQAAKERQAREAGTAELDPNHPPVGADAVILALCAGKKRLQDVKRPDLAGQADRLYTRYVRVLDALSAKFDARELTHGRSRSMVAEVCKAAADNLDAMHRLAAGVAGIDAAYVRRRLHETPERLHADERAALRERLELVADTERRLGDLAARNEAAMTTLDNAAVVMSRVQTDRPQAALGADQALGDLQRFLDQAERYGQPTRESRIS
ncbi:cobyrinic acid a,c-diamide synthase [uncultured Salinisphaera sp.]|uniref:cobyrinic acid a,c-diamide synthase n=1 Tax=uncultured Salinisphaera sp. TaxID=359372 RepID=UPI0032B13879|tara:strand:+ start:961 stop:1920 length:960 start_codon:yes stop_codon:yes gene_type:complete